MTRQAQKEEERFYLKEFLSLLPEEIKVVDDDRERPDFEVGDIGGRRIGLEVTLYHNGISGKHPRRAVEQAWEKLREKINEAVSCNPDLLNICVILIFKEVFVPSTQQLDSFIKELQCCAVANKWAVPLRITDFSNYPLLKEYLRSLSLKKVRCHIRWHSNLNAGWVGVDVDSLIHLVKTKVTDLERYSTGQDFDEYWLLIVSGGAISQSIGPRAAENVREIHELDGLLKQSKFNCAYLYQFMTNAICEWPD